MAENAPETVPFTSQPLPPSSSSQKSPQDPSQVVFAIHFNFTFVTQFSCLIVRLID